MTHEPITCPLCQSQLINNVSGNAYVYLSCPKCINYGINCFSIFYRNLNLGKISEHIIIDNFRLENNLQDFPTISLISPRDRRYKGYQISKVNIHPNFEQDQIQMSITPIISNDIPLTLNLDNIQEIKSLIKMLVTFS